MGHALERKMRRRIRRQIETGEAQHRVRDLNEGIFGYVVQHHGLMVRFRVAKTKVLGRCGLVRL